MNGLFRDRIPLKTFEKLVRMMSVCVYPLKLGV